MKKVAISPGKKPAKWSDATWEGYQLGRVQLLSELIKKFEPAGEAFSGVVTALRWQFLAEMHLVAKGPVGDRLFRKPKSGKKNRG